MKYKSKSRGPSNDSKKIFKAFGGMYKSSAGKEISSPLSTARFNSCCNGFYSLELSIYEGDYKAF